MMNYKNYLIGLILLISNYSSSAVAQNFIWAKNACATNNSTIYSNSMAVDNSGNVYTIGRVSGTCDFDPSANTFNLTGSLTTNDMYIQKLDSNGNLLWAKLIVGTFPYSASNLVKTDNSGNIYVTGSFGQTVDFDPGPAVHNITPQGYEIFILKLDSLGDFIWVKTIAGTSTGALKIDALVVDANNNLILGGPYTDIVDFDPNSGISNLSSLSIYSGYILKLTSTGNFVWVKSFNSNYSVRIIGMDVDATNNIYCSGTFSGTLDLDPDTATNNVSSALNTSNGYIVKLDSNGSHIFGESFGGTGNIFFATLDLDNNNNVIIGGTFKNFTDFDPSNADYNLYGPNSFFDVYLLKLSNTGTFIWAKQIQGYDDVELNGVDIDTTGSIYATGFFKSPTDF
ncbi:MAG: SBBP repeat-containing protein, partial [Chitinophagaceae bacterium]|nr:SBBP repeat-containing protein [Chitinophagaceae bacterium]